jgi:RNA polymerase sigma-70 factor, ECF subfamily
MPNPASVSPPPSSPCAAPLPAAPLAAEPGTTARREQALFLAWRAGNDGAGARLLRELRPMLLRHLRGFAPDVAEDLAHDALLALVRARQAIQDDRALRGYLFTVIRRSRARELARRDHPVEALDERRTPTRLTSCIELARIDVARLLANRESRCAGTVAEYYLAGFRASEIARARGISEATVRSRIRHGIDQLRRSACEASASMPCGG